MQDLRTNLERTTGVAPLYAVPRPPLAQVEAPVAVARPLPCNCPASTGEPPVFSHTEWGLMYDANHGLSKLHLFWAPQLDAILSRHGY